MAGADPGRTGERAVDEGRRRFFRQLAGEVLSSAAGVVAAASSLQRDSTAALLDTLNPVSGRADSALLSVPPPSVPVQGGPGGPGGTFRTPFRMTDDDTALLLIDQRRLPDELVEVEVRSAADAAAAIRDMVVRGAPAIGQVAAIGLALSAATAALSQPHVRQGILQGAAGTLLAARPTAVNLRWAVDRLMRRYAGLGDQPADGPLVARELRAEADRIVFETTTDHGRLAEHGLAVLPTPAGRPLRVLTHCNTGPLACGQYGTALGIVQAAHHAGRELHVWVDETRPYLQGARLTTWELDQAGVAHSLIPDAAAGHFIARGEVDVILVGADRIAANGDTANKVGTYPLAVLAARHRVPFLVCAPLSSVDLETPDGAGIPIEERPSDEVTQLRGRRIAPQGTIARNPAFDITPAELISGIVTEEGVLVDPFEPALRAAAERRAARWASDPEFGADRPAAATGASGAIGPAGAASASGAAGATGETGARGATGAPGAG